MALEKGYLLNDRYEIKEILGQGGMGAVYRAIDASLGVDVAVKENLIEDEEALRQFRREATILANMRHPNLPRVTDHFVIEDQGQYLVMDFIEGEDLRERMDRLESIPEKEVILMGIAISDALIYLHNLDPPILHRDIKPGNIKITPQGSVYLVDFGLAKIVEGSQQTTTGARGLTPGYSPPEQYGSARTDPRSDVYSLGATLYAALTGDPPEDGLSIAINQTDLTKVRDKSPKSSKQIAAIVEKALSVQPEDRYQTASDFKDSLLQASDTVQRNVAVGEVTIAPPPPGTFAETLRRDSEGTGKPRKKRKTGLILILLLLFTVAGYFGSVLFLGYDYLGILPPGLIGPAPTLAAQDPTEDLSAVDTSTDTPEPTEELEPTETPTNTITPTPTLTPTPEPTAIGGGSQIAFASNRSGQPQIWLATIGNREPVQLTDISGGACQPTWSPDGERLVFISPCRNNVEGYPGSSLFIINADGSNLSPLPSSPAGDYDPDWSPDGSKLVFTSLRDSNRAQIFTLDFGTTVATNLSNSFSTDFNPTWSPDGEFIAINTTRSGFTQIWYMGANGDPIDIFSRSDKFKNIDPVWSPDGSLILFVQLATSGSDIRPHLVVAQWNDGGQNRGFTEFRVTTSISSMRDPNYSPDGAWIVYSSNPEGANHDIYIMRSNGSGTQRITFDEALDFDPVWRPTSFTD